MLTPETIVYDNGKGRIIRYADLDTPEKTPNQALWDVSDEAVKFHENGRQFGSEGMHDLAIAAFQKASEAAPDWPYPVYDTAFTYLLMHDWPESLKHYRIANRLYPDGFFTTITAVDTLEREESGDLPMGLYLLYLQLEWTEKPEDKLKIIHLLIERCPNYAPGWKEMSFLVDTDAEKTECIEKGLATSPDAETLGMLLINKALIEARANNLQAAMKTLGELLLDGRTTQSNRIMARLAIKSILGVLQDN
jgi:tetratricopeptide (TPR) repeat protein